MHKLQGCLVWFCGTRNIDLRWMSCVYFLSKQNSSFPQPHWLYRFLQVMTLALCVQNLSSACLVVSKKSWYLMLCLHFQVLACVCYRHSSLVHVTSFSLIMLFNKCYECIRLQSLAVVWYWCVACFTETLHGSSAVEQFSLDSVCFALLTVSCDVDLLTFIFS